MLYIYDYSTYPYFYIILFFYIPMKDKSAKQEIQEKISEIFSKKSSEKEIKKAKKLAMSKNIKLKELRKKFCKKCYSPFDSDNSEIRVKKGFKILKCKKCGFLNRHKLK